MRIILLENGELMVYGNGIKHSMFKEKILIFHVNDTLPISKIREFILSCYDHIDFVEIEEEII